MSLGCELYEPVVILRPDVITCHPSARIDSFVKLEGGLGMTISAYVHIASFAHVGIGGGTTILRRGAMIASGAKILSGSNRYEGARSMSSAAPPEEQRVERLQTLIGENAFIGAGAIIMPGVTVGAHAVVGAGAVVLQHVPPHTIVAGNPARKIGRWDLV